jgi:hypothetical protein
MVTDKLLVNTMGANAKTNAKALQMTHRATL